VAVDFSDESSLATSMAARLLGGTETGSDRQRLPELILLHTIELMIEWPTPDVPDLLPRHWDDEETAAKRRLESIAAGLRSDRLSVEARTLRGYAPEVIEEQVLTTKPDLVALGTRGQSGLAQLMVGSVTASVLQHVTCPVLTTRRAKAEDATQGQQ
jgi:nucleotide-binding universal stress UspA family protein